MKQLFVTPEIAIALKEKGFNEPCLGHYNSNNEFMFFADVRNCNTNSEFGFYPTVPTHQQVTDWLREKHKIFITVDVSPYPTLLSYGHIKTFTDRKGKWTNDQDSPLPYYKALNKAIEESLKLI